MDISLPQLNERYRAESPQARASSRIRIQVPVFLRASDSTGVEFIELTKTLNISCPRGLHRLNPHAAAGPDRSSDDSGAFGFVLQFGTQRDPSHHR